MFPICCLFVLIIETPVLVCICLHTAVRDTFTCKEKNLGVPAAAVRWGGWWAGVVCRQCRRGAVVPSHCRGGSSGSARRWHLGGPVCRCRPVGALWPGLGRPFSGEFILPSMVCCATVDYKIRMQLFDVSYNCGNTAIQTSTMRTVRAGIRQAWCKRLQEVVDHLTCSSSMHPVLQLPASSQEVFSQHLGQRTATAIVSKVRDLLHS